MVRMTLRATPGSDSSQQGKRRILETMPSSTPVVLSVAVCLAALLASTALVLSSTVVSVSVWLTQRHPFATHELSFYATSASSWKETREARGGLLRHEDASTKLWRHVTALWFHPASGWGGIRRKSSAAATLEMWHNEGDALHDSDACVQIYKDSKQSEVCVISI